MTGVTRRPVFDPTALDDLDELLPPRATPTPPPPTPLVPTPPADAAPAAIAVDEPAVAATAPEPDAQTQGGGGERQQLQSKDKQRTSTAGDDDGNSTPGEPKSVSVRIPRELYTAIHGSVLSAMDQRPSYAQLITWTIEDHREDALQELREHNARRARAPRGRRLASDSVPLIPRFLPQELAVLEQFIDDAGGASRTDAVVAALRVALRHAGH